MLWLYKSRGAGASLSDRTKRWLLNHGAKGAKELNPRGSLRFEDLRPLGSIICLRNSRTYGVAELLGTGNVEPSEESPDREALAASRGVSGGLEVV